MNPTLAYHGTEFLVSLVVCQACMARTHRMEPFLALSLPAAEDQPTRPGSCAPASDSGQELDKQSDVVHAEGDSDADEEDNGDTGPIIFSLLSELDPPPASVSDTAITATRARFIFSLLSEARPAAGDTGPIIFSLLSELDPPPASVSDTAITATRARSSSACCRMLDPPPASVSVVIDGRRAETSRRLSQFRTRRPTWPRRSSRSGSATLIVDRAGAAAAADSCGDEPGPLTVNGRPSSPVEADASPAGRVPLVGESADKAPNGAPETAGADQVCSFSLRKVNRHVQFGERLDLAPFCSSISQDLPQMRAGQRRVLYSLFGVVEHSGSTDQRPLHSLRARAPPGGAGKTGEGEDPAAAPQESQTDQKQPASEPETEPEPQPEAGRWFYVSDTHVTEVTLDKVLKAQAYMLFYERIV
ncbi:Ubiquitin carboxyl-terminal hydrolase 16 [Amphibalanus amphitrite]|uniref:Ubiquitin carboxyl-terminal hydrolase 16 n=1 Tax=Amphibalanus amphitrite TaxID=1232801 RepID=A0A6A4WHL1_AMPAM|nr:Ubiquitin carboxyl-terminal hydrolase 16 [Amphibalanus amphitrite]